MPKITTDIPVSLELALKDEIAKTGTDESSTVITALAQYLKTPVHTLFQVSTSGALVAGVYSGAVSVGSLLQHGDIGLGTFANLDGEMVVLDGHAFQVQGSGRVFEAPANARVPFAVVTEFSSDIDSMIGPITSFAELEKQCDSSRKSGNIFYAFRLDGKFNRIRTRAVNPPESGTRLVDAAKSQSEFHFSNVAGSLVGLWSPGFSSAFSVAGYHFHFLSDDRQEGGHLLDLESESLRLRVEALTDFHLALPETEAFLKADLSKNTADELAYAESAH
ncbi:MAG TPA: acetolactate decarboxylase [Chthoniobacterales bacterium]|jgi:acetolactate decarboxylase